MASRRLTAVSTILKGSQFHQVERSQILTILIGGDAVRTHKRLYRFFDCGSVWMESHRGVHKHKATALVVFLFRYLYMAAASFRYDEPAKCRQVSRSTYSAVLARPIPEDSVAHFLEGETPRRIPIVFHGSVASWLGEYLGEPAHELRRFSFQALNSCEKILLQHFLFRACPFFQTDQSRSWRICFLVETLLPAYSRIQEAQYGNPGG